jgi:hypothetical protein
MLRLIGFVPVAVLLLISACGGGGNGGTLTGGGGGGTTSGSNVAPITVDAGPTQNSVNTPFVTVTVCSPGSTSNCQTIDHIEVDTASYGLRVLSSALSSSLALQQETDASGSPLVECAVFADGISWGPVKMADLQVAGETATGIPMQVIGDSAFPTPPTDCSSQGTTEDTVASFGANGILGVGPFVQDDGTYYTCPAGVCSQTTSITVGEEVSNPVAYFAADNNGVIVELPQVPTGGATSLTGSLVFGIGTESNNGLANATIYAVDPNNGNLTVTYKNNTYDDSFIDSGSNANYFSDSTIPPCTSGFYCPLSTLSLAATNTGVNGASGTVSFSVANADNLFSGNPSGVAFASLAGPNPDSSSFDWGLPFFFGRHVYTAIADQNTPGGIGPYVAY